MAINNSKLILSPTLQQNFIDPNTRFPALAQIYFFKAGTTIPKSVYQRSNDPSNPYVATPNPLPLDASGSLPYDIFFYPLNDNDSTLKELYDIYVYTTDAAIVSQTEEIACTTDQDGHVAGNQSEINPNGVEIFKRLNWPPVDNGVTNGNIADDYIVNGQFNYPINFYNSPKDKVGQIDNKKTAVCFGWEYDTDADLELAKRYVTFEEVLNDTFNNLPKYLITVDSLAIDNLQTLNCLSQRIGPVEDLAGKTVTFAFDGKDASGDGVNIDLVLERNYGNPVDGASEPEIIKIETFTLRTEMAQYIKTFEVPSLNGKTLAGNSSLTLRFEMPLQNATKISLTSVIARLGVAEFPEFINLPVSFLNSQIIGQGIDLQGKSTADNFSMLSYFNGDFFFQAKTGTYELLDIDAAKAKQNVIILTDEDQEFSRNEANEYGIPYSNLYEVLGLKWGSRGDLQVTCDATSLTFTSLVDGDPHSNNSYSVGTTDWKLTEVQKSNKFGITLTKKQPNKLEFVSVGNGNFSNPVWSALGYFDADNHGAFWYSYSADGNINSHAGRPSEHLLLSSHVKYTGGAGEGQYPPLGTKFVLNNNEIIDVIDTAVGDHDNPWKSEVTFFSNNLLDYKTDFVLRFAREYPGGPVCNFKYNVNTISFSTADYNVGGTYDIKYPSSLRSPNKLLIAYEVNGQSTISGIDENVIAKVKLKSTDTINTLLDNTVKAVNTRFIEKFEPNTFKAGEWIGFGSTSIDYYVFFKVDGVGDDPKPDGLKSSVEDGVNLISTDTMEDNIKKINDAIQLDNFIVPAADKVMTIPAAAADKVVGVIYL